MSFQKEMFSLIAQLTGQENVLAVPKDFIRYAGDSDTGLFLSQLIYWCDKGKRKDGFIYKTNKDWQEELGLTSYKVRKARKNLEKKGILETKVKKANGNPTVHYKILKDAFVQSFLKYQQKENGILTDGMYNTPNSLTETTTEITTETTTHNLREIHSYGHEYLDEYSDAYIEYFNEEHPPIPEESIDKIIAQLSSYDDNYGIEEGHIYKIALLYFDDDEVRSKRQANMACFAAKYVRLAGAYIGEY